ncbi:MAG: hypothetical protein COS89_03600 [Deltaproteobacteria bacterium CG07_land_8_20_14_0_80_38_7]|nr:MAG: hypothetical protein COS89_03600 [Deltaproteobacteria bacterium CG07_land_8_20_14_0_80_38_7]
MGRRLRLKVNRKIPSHFQPEADPPLAEWGEQGRGNPCVVRLTTDARRNIIQSPKSHRLGEEYVVQRSE